MDFTKTLERYRSELVDSVVPFWERHAIDRECGGYFTCLDRDGSVYDTEKHMWMQWRIVYMFATLHAEIRPDPAWLRIAQEGFDFLVKHGKSEDGTYYFSLNRRGEPTIAPCNIYSDCFAAMGAAALYKATGDARHRAEADAAMKSYIGRMANPKGRWDKSMPARPKRLSHGHFMILANLGSVMAECLGSTEYEADTARAVDAVLGTFWNPERQILFENVNLDGSFDLDSCEGRFVNPGHGLESMWFIMKYAERAGNAAMIRKAAGIVRALNEFGTDREHGGLYYFMDALGRPNPELQWDMKLWWPHCEAILAALYAYRLTGDAYFLDMFKTVDAWSFSHFKDTEHPEWFGYLNRRGEPTHLLKGGKWKTMFHLPRALLVAIRQMEAIQGQ